MKKFPRKNKIQLRKSLIIRDVSFTNQFPIIYVSVFLLSKNDFKFENPDKDSEYQESTDSCSTKQILDDHSKDNVNVDSIQKTSDDEKSDNVRITILENHFKDEISEVSGEIDELEFYKHFNILATGLITDHITEDQKYELEHKNLEKITEVRSKAVAENLVDRESDINYEISSENSENSEKDIEENVCLDDENVKDLTVDEGHKDFKKIILNESKAKSEHLFDSKSVENHIKPEKNFQKSVEYPHDITTRLGIDRNYVVKDEIKNLQVTLVPIMTQAHLTQPGSFEEKTLIRPQSPVCDFIRKVLLESYV